LKETTVSPSTFTIPHFIRECVRKNPRKTFLVFKRDSYSYDEIDTLSSQFANVLQSKGVGKGSKVAIKLRNCPEFLITWFGVAKAGCLIVPINPSYKREETLQIIFHSDAEILVVSEDLSEKNLGIPSTNQLIISREGFGTFYEAIDSFSNKYSPPDIEPDDPVSIIYTSGTTGLPKGVVQSHRTYVLTGEAFPRWLGLSSSDRLMTCLPLSHINAQAYSVMGTLGARATLILQEKFSLTRFWTDIEESRATEVNTIGSMLMLLFKNPQENTRHPLRLIYNAPCLPESVRTELEKRYMTKIFFGYGLSECTFGFIEEIAGERKPLSMGRPRGHPLFANEAMIADENDAEVPRGVVGEILLRNKAIMNEYYKDPEHTAFALRNGWLHTGDLGYCDLEGNYYFVDRNSDIIRRKGENISSSELESLLASHPSILECAAVGIPSELSDEDIVVFAVRKPGSTLTEGEVKKWYSQRLADFKIPSKIIFCETLPKTATFRIAKNKLRLAAKEMKTAKNLQPGFDPPS
jgi:carnitine-CoA ligase